jgi:glycosyltransferase involved in cell wall biosynthesis
LISIIIPSHKSIDSLFHVTLQSLADQHYAREDYEVIIVDNPRDDVLRKHVAENCPSNFRMIESELGSNRSRNKGIAAAKFPIIAVTDDDTVIPPDWLKKLESMFTLCPDAGCIGGPMDVKFIEDKPAWLEGELLFPLSYTVHHAVGDYLPRELNTDEGEWLISANLAFSKANWSAVGGFQENIGLHGLKKNTSNDELEFIEACAKLGKVYYCPTLMIKHQIPPQRATVKYLCEREYGQGSADGEMYLRKNPSVSVNDVYHDYAQHHAAHFYFVESTAETRDVISNESVTREYIRILLLTKTAKLIGLHEALHGVKLWEVVGDFDDEVRPYSDRVDEIPNPTSKLSSLDLEAAVHHLDAVSSEPIPKYEAKTIPKLRKQQQSEEA